ncbi:MAG TPA: PrsW family glutamic-type intramembrane protease, partial [Candidatus Thermoplasmatota archaeon]|nr:PrsW family glutamic-type intramembrane protease [Candidatus Thermoplasmatota archaeon]
MTATPLPPPAGGAAAPPHGQPVYQALDSHEITTWSPRTGFDRFSATLAEFVKAHWLKLLVAYMGIAVLAISSNMLTDVVNAGIGGTFLAMTMVSLIPFLLVMGFVYVYDRTSKEPLPTLVLTFVLGALLAEISRAVNSSFGDAFGFFGPVFGGILAMFLVTGPIEEVSKWLSVRVHAYNLPSFDDVIDGAIYGIAAGAGFAWWENWSYIYQGVLNGANATGTLEGAIAGGWGIVLIRGIGFLAHPVWAGISGYYLALAKFNPEHRNALIAKGLLIPALMHGASNSYLTVVDALGVGEGAFWALLIVDYLFIFGCAAFLFNKMKKN